VAFCIKDPELPVILVPAVCTLLTPEMPVSAALAASQMFGEIVVPQFTRGCACAADKPDALAP